MNILPKINGWNNNSFAEQLFIIAVVGIFFGLFFSIIYTALYFVYLLVAGIFGFMWLELWQFTVIFIILNYAFRFLKRSYFN
jgi:hypothetical protein